MEGTFSKRRSINSESPAQDIDREEGPSRRDITAEMEQEMEQELDEELQAQPLLDSVRSEPNTKIKVGRDNGISTAFATPRIVVCTCAYVQ